MIDTAKIKVHDNMADLPEMGMGEPLAPILFLYGHWAVTTYGIEHISGSYAFEGQRVFETDWIHHMAEKNWVELKDFTSALYKARDIFEKSGELKPRYKAAPVYTLVEALHRQ